MIISRTPFRMSFFGGGTDYPKWVKEHGGAVLSTTFDKYSYITSRKLPPFFDHNYRITYSRVENKKNIESIVHPAIKAVLNELENEEGLEIHCDADLPARSGLGSSSSFVVGLLHTLTALNDKRVSKEWLANEAIRIERDVLKENVGSQDQVAAAFGGLNQIIFKQDNSIHVDPLVLSQQKKTELNNHLMLFFTGFSRISSKVAESQLNNMSMKANEMHRIRSMVDDAVKILTGNDDIKNFGELLHQSWINKKSLSEKISNSFIDNLYSRTRKLGCIGGKILGAGGGGFMLLFVEPSKQKVIKEELSNLVHVPFKFENTGSQIIYYQP